MNNTNGALDFEATMNNDKFIGAIAEAERRVKGFSQATVKEGEKIDDAFRITAENIRIQKDVIAQIESQIKQLNKQIDNTAPGMAQNELRKQASGLTGELNAEKKALEYLEQQVKETETAHVTFRTQLRNVREELIQMEMAGKRGTAEYDALQKKAGELNDAYKDAQQQMTVLANDERGFQGVVSALSGVTGAFSAAQGAVGLFTGENENLNRIMLKVQSLMAVTIGLQQVAQTLNKDSYFQVVMLTKAKNLLAIAETKLATAFGISTAAARVMMATLTFGLSAAITAAVILIEKFVSKQKEAAKQQKELYQAIADSSTKPMIEFERLRRTWANLGNDMASKQKFIEENAEAFKSLGLEVNVVADAQRALVTNSDAVTSSLLKQAEAAAKLEFATKKYNEILVMQEQLKNTPKTKTKIVAGGYMGQGAIETFEVENKEWTRLNEKIQKAIADYNKLFDESIDASNDANKDLENLNKESIQVIVNQSIGQINAAIEAKRQALDKITNKADYNKAIAEIEVLQKQLESITADALTTFIERLNEQKKRYEDYENVKVAISEEKAREMYKDLEGSYEEFLIKMMEKYKDNPIYAPIIAQELAPFVSKRREDLNQQMNEADQKRKQANDQLIEQYNMEAELLANNQEQQNQIYKEIIAQAKAEERLNTSLAKAANITAIMAENFRGVDGKFSEIVSQLSDAFEKMLRITEDFKVMGDPMASSRDKLYAGMDALSTVASQISQLVKELNQISIVKESAEMAAAMQQIAFTMDRINRSAESDKLAEYDKALKQIEKTAKTIRNDYKDITLEEIEDAIIKHKGNLGSRYFFGGTYDKNQQAMLDDWEALRDLKLEELDIERQRQELLTGTSSQSITDMLVEGLESGYDSVDDFGDKVESVLKKAVISSFSMKYVQPIVDKWYTGFVEASEDGIDESEAQKLQNALNNDISGILKAWEPFQKMINETFGMSNEGSGSSLSGAIKGVSEETANILAGQINAIRINQAEAGAILRSQLFALTEIAQNTSIANNHLQKLDRIVELLNTDSARAKGF